MNKYLYEILKLDEKPWIKFWLIKKKTWYTLSEILKGTNFTINNTKYKKFNIFNIFGNSVQIGNPSPENETEINSSGENGYINQNIINKNFLPNEIQSTTINGITVTRGLDGGLLFNGTATKNTYFYLFENKNIKIPAGSYILSTHKSGTVSGNSYLEIDDVNGNVVSGSALNVYNRESKTITLENEIYIKQASLYFNSGRILDNFKIYPMVEKGSTITDFEEHKEQIFNIPCQQPMRKIGDVADTFIKENGVWYERHNIIKLILDGTENWNTHPNGINSFTLANLINTEHNENKLLILSNYFKGIKWSDRASTGNNLIYTIGNKQFVIRNTTFSTVEDFKSWLAENYSNENPAYIVYILAEPIDLQCTSEQIQALENLQNAKSYNNQTNIYSNDEVPANLEIQCFLKKEGE